MSVKKETDKEIKGGINLKTSEKMKIITSSEIEDLLNDKRKSIKRSSVSKSEEGDSSCITTQWVKKKMIILDMLDVLDMPSTPSHKSSSLIDINEMRENLLLMKGELPTSYQQLCKRFHGCDLYLRQNYPNESLLKDINNYLSLSDLKLSFTEDHVSSIVYLYAYNEKDEKKKTAYILGRVQPRSYYEFSQLTMRLPSHKKETASSQVYSFLSHKKNLNKLFESMDKKEEESSPSQREEQLTRHIQEYVDSCYKKYLQRTHQKECAHGRVPGFTIQELGKMPASPLPPPLVVASPNVKEYLKQKL